MSKAHTTSINREISGLAIIAVSVALLITFVFTAAYTISFERRAAIEEIKTYAKITALNSQSALLFSDSKISQETIDALAPHEDIIEAEIATKKGERLARRVFEQNQEKQGTGRWFATRIAAALFGRDAVVTVEQPVLINGQTLGKVTIKANLIPALLVIVYSLGVFLAAMAIAFAVSLLLIRKKVRKITLPIERLSASAHDIAVTRQYSQRVEKLADDELGVLTEQFNAMLGEVEKRDQALLDKNDSLELEVESRTQAIRNAMGEMSSLLNSMAEGAFGMDIMGKCKFVNASFLRILGHESAEVIVGKHMHEIIQPRHADGSPYPAAASRIDNANSRGVGIHVADEVFWRKDGVAIPVEYWLEPLIVDGIAQGAVATFIDITERRKAETELKIAAAAFESQEGMLVTDANAMILRVNQAFTTITGYSAKEVIGKNPRLLNSGRQDAAFYAAMWDSINSTGAWSGEIWNQRKSGDVYPEHLTVTAVKDSSGAVTHYVATLIDITTSKAAAEKIEQLAFYDPLTNLPNRRLLLDRLKQVLASSARSGKEGALLFIDLDDFKTLNDTLGHDVGDLLLKQVALRLESCVREGDSVARLGGDEFVVMLEDLNDDTIEAAAQTEVVGEKILATLNQPYQLGIHNYHNTPSIGATLFNHHPSTIDDLLKQADIAMYQAKKAGRNTLRFFDPKMQDAINTRVVMAGELRSALERQQFHLYYQSQATHDGKIVSAEALIRWQHPEQGVVSPLDFIPLAEENGLILPIGLWVLETACTQLKKWQDDPLASHLLLAVNLSARQFHQPDFVEQVLDVLEKTGIDPGKLKLELTESLLLDYIDDAILKMNALRAIGVRFSMDDFGTGFSSLAYLTRLPLSQLKIDQSFVRNLGIKPSDEVIVQTIIGMASNLEMAVIAEGVETEEQRAFLELHGCPQCQGYLFSKPLPLEEFEALLKKARSAAL